MRALFATGRRLLGQTPPAGCAACIVVDGVILGVSRDPQAGSLRQFKVQPSALAENDSPIRGESLAACLDRSQYLLKVVEIPSVEPQEVKSALALEVEALLPAEFGELEISCHALSCEKSGYQRYEVYVASRKALGDYIDRFAKAGLELQSLIPSAVAWRRLLASHREFDVMIAPLGDGRLELAALCPDDSLVIRTLGGSPGCRPGACEIESFLAPLTDTLRKGPLDARVGWLSSDDDPPPIASARPVVCDGHSGALPLLAEIACCYAEPAGERCDLMPADRLAGTQWRSALRGMVSAGVIAVLGIILIYAAVAISSARLRSATADLDADIARIKGEGETIGRGIEQLSAIDAARATRNDFHQIIDGLLAATPPGVTYSQVDFRSSGELVLHGSASSLSLVFTLPQTLERQSMFSKVLLKDAGQSKGSGGVSAEFDIQCTLARRSDR